MHHHRHLALASGLLILAFTGPTWAQSWRGSEAIGVQASDSKGKPIVGARVVLTFQGGGSQSDPPEVATNQKGRAVVAGLAMGSWQVEVKHPDFLSYVAVFDLDRGKQPSINASFLEAGGRSLTPMKVKLSKGNPRDASPPLPAQEARAQAPPPPTVEPDRPSAEAEAAPVPPTNEAPSSESIVEVETAPQEVAERQPPPVEEVQVAARDATPPAAERPTELEESPTVEPEVAKLSEPEQEEISDPKPTGPAAIEPAAPIAPMPEPQAESELQAEATDTEPEVPTDVPAETPIIAAEPPRTEATEAAETATQLAEPSPQPKTEAVPAPPKPVEEEPTVEIAQVAEAPIERQPEPMPDEPADQLVVPSEVVEEAISPEPATAEVAPAVEEVAVDSPPSQEAEVPVVETVVPPRVPAPRSAIPDDTPTITSYRDGSCSDCRTGEWAVTTLQMTAAGSAPCPAGVYQAAQEAADSLGNSTQLELSGFVGPAADGSDTEALAAVEPEISQAYEQALAPYLGGASNCQVVSVILPTSVRFVGFRFEAFDTAGGGECAPDRGCTLPQAQWLANPVVQRGFNATVVWGIFENSSAQSPRTARLKVYFRAPNSRWQPSTR